MTLLANVAQNIYYYRFEKDAENKYLIKVQDLTVGGVHNLHQGGWTAEVRRICAYKHVQLEVCGFSSREAAAKYILNCYEDLYSSRGSQSPNELQSVLDLVGDTFKWQTLTFHKGN